MAEETNEKAAAEQPPSTAEQQTPSVAKEHAPSTSEEQATDIPTANMPDPEPVKAERKSQAADPEKADATAEGEAAEKPAKAKAAGKPAAAKKADGDATPAKAPKAEKADGDATPAKAPKAEKADGDATPAKAPKKEKAPAVEDKPFADFMHQDCLPALKTALNKQGIEDVELSLEKQKFPISGVGSAEECWQLTGRWKSGKRQFHIYFPKADIQGPRAFSCADSGAKPSTIEPFLIDERKVTLDLLVFGVVQRLNAQKWLAKN